MKLSANQAHKRAGVAKKTLLKALEDGTLSGSKNDRGHWEIDQSELDRVYPQQGDDKARPQVGNTSETTETHIENRVLAVRLEEQDKAMRRLERDLDDMREQRDKWQSTADRLLLTSNQNTPQTSEKSPSGGLFGFFRRAGA